MNSILNIMLGLIMFLFLITIHEGGHFLGAKLSGIKVNEFSIGMGPTILNKQGEETLYSLRAFPVGGYVMMEGEESDSNDARSYNNSKPWKRFLTILAGPATNLIFALIIIFCLSFVNGVPSTIIDDFSENSPAKLSGMQVGDKIIKINDSNINIFADINDAISVSNDNLDIQIERNGEKINFEVSTISDNGRKIIGISPQAKNDFLFNLGYSFNMTIYMIKQIWIGLTGLISGVLGLEQLSGPVGVIKMVGTAANMGVSSFLLFAAMISINLGFFNLLPIPALDGSKLLFILVEMIIGKPINRKFEERISIIGFILLMGLIVLITIKDVISLF